MDKSSRHMIVKCRAGTKKDDNTNNDTVLRSECVDKQELVGQVAEGANSLDMVPTIPPELQLLLPDVDDDCFFQALTILQKENSDTLQLEQDSQFSNIQETPQHRGVNNT